MSKIKQEKGNEGGVTMGSIVSGINTVIGIAVLVVVGYKWSNYLQQLHENQMFFSEIKVSTYRNLAYYKLNILTYNPSEKFMKLKLPCFIFQEVEREISFRTESGLYYSYFKHLVNADSVLTGKHELSKDNLTEHLNPINIFSRFNIHQELFLAAVYKMYDFGMKPILFYVEFVFSMQGFYMGIIMTLCWVLSGSWLPSILTAAFITCHRY